MTDTNRSLVLDELDNAKRKHPKFVDHFSRKCDLFDFTAFKLDDSRRILRQRTEHGCVNFEAVLECEMWEAIEAYEKGDLAHARQELAQCAAVCIRAMEQIEGEMNARNTEHTNTTTTTGEKP